MLFWKLIWAYSLKMQYFYIGDCAKMILQIAKIEIEITNQSFEFSANTYLRVCIQIETS